MGLNDHQESNLCPEKEQLYLSTKLTSAARAMLNMDLGTDWAFTLSNHGSDSRWGPCHKAFNQCVCLVEDQLCVSLLGEFLTQIAVEARTFFKDPISSRKS